MLYRYRRLLLRSIQSIIFVFCSLYLSARTNLDHVSTNFNEVDIIGNTINIYQKVVSIAPCDNELVVESSVGLKKGDTILLIQMKGAEIDKSNSSRFGTIISLNNAGGYEFNYIQTIIGNQIILRNSLTRKYDPGAGAVQIVRVPYFKNKVEVRSELTCLPWNGSTGGVLVFTATQEVSLFSNIDVSGRGFLGGKSPNRNYNFVTCFANDFVRGPNDKAGQKGESFVSIADNLNYGKGAIGTGGGGGLDHNSGGGGGGNGGHGGMGGYQLDQCNNQPFNNRGLGGTALDSLMQAGRLFLGGGGGAGDANNPPGFSSNGGNGGGIVIIKAARLIANNFRIISNGRNGNACVPDGQFGKCHEGMGGGGAGGSIFLDIPSFPDLLTLSARGGDGADMSGDRHGRLGPGGGGGGGVISIPELNPNISSQLTGGRNGVNINYANDAWGSTPGNVGQLWQRTELVFSETPFAQNETLTVNMSIAACKEVVFETTSAINLPTLALWDLGDGNYSSSLSGRHNYQAAGKYPFSLTIESPAGCQQKALGEIMIPEIRLERLEDLEKCENEDFEIKAVAYGEQVSYQWTGGANLEVDAVSTAKGRAVSSQYITLAVKDRFGCSAVDSLFLAVRPLPKFDQPPAQFQCENDSLRLISGNDRNLDHRWSPPEFFDNAESFSPAVKLQNSGSVILTLRDSFCSVDSNFTVLINVRKSPTIKLVSSNDVDCDYSFAKLTASGGLQYFYENADSVYGPGNALALVYPKKEGTYRVTGIDNFGCSGSDSVLVKVLAESSRNFTLPNAFSPNRDGINDCFGIAHWGPVDLIDFSIFNRWGEKIFATRDPSKCWDGTYRGRKQESGGYVYMINIKRPCGDVQKKGIFYLIN